MNNLIESENLNWKKWWTIEKAYLNESKSKSNIRIIINWLHSKNNKMQDSGKQGNRKFLGMICQKH